MRRRNRLFTSQTIDLESDQQGPVYMHPGGCFPLTACPQPDIPTWITSAGGRHGLDIPHNAMFYGMPQHHGFQHHPAAPNFYFSYAAPSSSVAPSHGSFDQAPSSGNYATVGTFSNEYGTNGHLMDNTSSPCPYKRKNAEVNPGNFHQFYPSASTSSLDTSLNTRHSDAVSMMDATSFSVLHNQNHFIPGNFVGQPYQPVGSLWLDQQLASNSRDASGSAWPQSATIPFVHGNMIDGNSMGTGDIIPSHYHDPASNRSNTNFSPPSSANIRHHNFHHLLPVQGMTTHSINVRSQVPAASFSHPSSYSSQIIHPSHDGFDARSRHAGSFPPSDIRMYRPRRDGVMHDSIQRHHSHPRLRVLPIDGVALMDLHDYYEQSNDDDHHRDMRLDIEDMSYEELLALEEWIGNVNTGVSEGTIKSQLKTRMYSLSPINLEVVACDDEKPSPSCIICQDDYIVGEKVGILDCGHEYHADCLKQWLLAKNVCPICKSEALPT